MEGESSPCPPDGRRSESEAASSKPEPGRKEKQLKRVRRFEDDDSSDEEQEVEGDTSPNQPATKKMRKWVDSDSGAETSEEEEGEGSPVTAGGERERGIAMATGGEGSDSEDDELKIDLNVESARQSEGEEEREGIRSPVCETVELLEGERDVAETQGEGEPGSLANLEMTETMAEY